MLLTWFLLVAIMITGYVVLDGFDLGAGILHLFIARTDEERQIVIRTIGPVWDGNEVWLVAGGGTLYFAFPLLYASGFSGFYLPLMIVLWLLDFARDRRGAAHAPRFAGLARAFRRIVRAFQPVARRFSTARHWGTFCAACLSARINTFSCRSGPTGESGPNRGF